MKVTRTTLPDDFFLGLDAFNQGLYYDAHEHFENAWRNTPGEEREFFRAFLHLSGGFYRLTQNRPGAARKFFTHAEKWFIRFPDQLYGFDLGWIRNHLQHLIRSIDRNIPSELILSAQFQPIHPVKGRSA